MQPSDRQSASTVRAQVFADDCVRQRQRRCHADHASRSRQGREARWVLMCIRPTEVERERRLDPARRRMGQRHRALARGHGGDRAGARHLSVIYNPAFGPRRYNPASPYRTPPLHSGRGHEVRVRCCRKRSSCLPVGSDASRPLTLTKITEMSIARPTEK